MTEQIRFDIVDGIEPRSGRITMDYEGERILSLEAKNPHLLVAAALVVLGYQYVTVETEYGKEQFDEGKISRFVERQTDAVARRVSERNGYVTLVMRYSDAFEEYRTNVYLDGSQRGSSVDGRFDRKALLGILHELQYDAACHSIPT
jgi:hypothetical protein